MKNLSIFFICLLLVAPCFARTITVDDDGFADFNNIQAAINDANDGDTVLYQLGIVNAHFVSFRAERSGVEKSCSFDSFDAAQDRFNRSLHFGQIQSGLRSR